MTSAEPTLSDGILRITLSSRDGMNILGVDTRKEIMETMKEYESDDEVLCVVISAVGRVFSAGADLRYLLDLDEHGALEYARFVRSFLDYVEDYPKPTLGLVDGLAVGGGLELLMTLDLVLASHRARFGQTELNVGLIPGGGGTQRLARLVGVRKAKEMVYTGELISALEAYELGLVSKVAESGEIEKEAMKLIDKLRSKFQKNLHLAKRAMNKGLREGMRTGLDEESELYAQVLADKETKESIRKFLGRSQEAH